MKVMNTIVFILVLISTIERKLDEYKQKKKWNEMIKKGKKNEGICDYKRCLF